MMNAAMTPEASADFGLTLGELAALLQALGPTVHGDASVRVTGVHQDSRRIEVGDVFAARSGGKKSGLDFAEDARARGAAALLTERGTGAMAWTGPRVEVSDVRLASAIAAEALYGYPTRGLGLVGITGTNGKTTTAWLVEHALLAIGGRPARLGTLGSSFLGAAEEGSLTTPEADDISRYAQQRCIDAS